MTTSFPRKPPGLCTSGSYRWVTTAKRSNCKSRDNGRTVSPETHTRAAEGVRGRRDIRRKGRQGEGKREKERELYAWNYDAPRDHASTRRRPSHWQDDVLLPVKRTAACIREVTTLNLTRGAAHTGWDVLWSSSVLPNHIHGIVSSVRLQLPHFVTNWLHGDESFLRKRLLCSNSKTSKHFMEPEGSLPCTQEPSTGT
jgi:hypothetical protein